MIHNHISFHSLGSTDLKHPPTLAYSLSPVIANQSKRALSRNELTQQVWKQDLQLLNIWSHKMSHKREIKMWQKLAYNHKVWDLKIYMDVNVLFMESGKMIKVQTWLLFFPLFALNSLSSFIVKLSCEC